MALFEWTQEHSVSVLRFDTDHKKLFALINELNDAMSEGRGRFVVVRVLQELGEYARWHFAGEESAMRRAGYAGLEEHIAEHRQFTSKVEGFYAEFGESRTGIPIDVLYFLRDWLLKHILSTDRQYSESLNRAGIH
jgi:hemerythrin-like metal-binding protein